MNAYAIFVVNNHLQVLLDEAAARRGQSRSRSPACASGSLPLRPRSSRPSTPPRTTAGQSSRTFRTIRTAAEASSPRLRATSLPNTNGPRFLLRGLSCVCRQAVRSVPVAAQAAHLALDLGLAPAGVDAIDRIPVGDEPELPTRPRRTGATAHRPHRAARVPDPPQQQGVHEHVHEEMDAEVLAGLHARLGSSAQVVVGWSASWRHLGLVRGLDHRTPWPPGDWRSGVSMSRRVASV